MADHSTDEGNKSGLVAGIAGELMQVAKEDPATREAGKNVGQSLKIVTGTIKRALFPLAVINYGYDKAEVYFKEHFQNDMTSLTKDIPAEFVTEPKSSVAGPALQGLAYAHDEAELKNMFLKLLASSMDSRKANRAHPSYVEIIKELTAEEASLVKLYLSQPQIPIILIKKIISADGSYQTVLRHVTATVNQLKQPTINPMIQAYIENWIRLGLIEVDYSIHLTDNDQYSWAEDRPEFKSAVRELPRDKPEYVKIEFQKGIMTRTDYGNIFSQVVGLNEAVLPVDK